MQTAAAKTIAFKAAPTVPCARRATVRCASFARPEKLESALKGAAVTLSGLLLAGAASANHQRLTFDELQAMAYKEAKGTGVAAMCPMVSPGADSDLSNMPPGTYQMDRFCMEPTAFNVKLPGDSKFQPSTLLTRNTYLLSEMTGTVNVAKDGTVELVHGLEDDGLDYAAVTVRPPGVTEVPLMFSVKDLHARGPWNDFSGRFTVQNYRGASFMDTIGRGGATGWDWQKGLPAADQDLLARENDKSFDPTPGQARFAITKADPVSGEVEGVFITHQLSSDDMGAKDPSEVEVQGIWYAQLNS